MSVSYSELRDRTLQEELALGSALPPHPRPTSAHVKKKTDTDNDIIRIASSVPLCSDVVFPLAMASNDPALLSLLRTVLNADIVGLRVLMPEARTPHYPEDTTDVVHDKERLYPQQIRGSTIYCHCTFNGKNGPEVVLVMLRACNLLIPSSSLLDTIDEEARALWLIGKTRELREPAVLHGFRHIAPITQHPNFEVLLGYTRVQTVVLVRDHVDDSFSPFVSLASADQPLTRCIYGVQSNFNGNDSAPASSPWNAVRHTFVSLRQFHEEFASSAAQFATEASSSTLFNWLFLLSEQPRISFAEQLPASVRNDETIWAIWQKMAAMAADDSVMQLWMQEAVKNAKGTQAQALEAEETQLLNRLAALRGRLESQ